MPRVRQKAQEYAVADFQKEIRRQQGEYGLMSARSLATAANIPVTTFHDKMKDPMRFTVSDLQKLVETIRPNPMAVLGLLGYSAKDLRRCAGQGDRDESL